MDEWDKIYKKFNRPLFLYAMSLTKKRSDAEDLVHETFVKAFLSYQEKGSIKSWLVTVLKNEFINQYKKSRREILDLGRDLLENIPIEDNTISLIIKDEQRQILYKEILNLPINMRIVMMESIYLQLTDDEISRINGFSKENVRQLRSRAKKRLIERMQREEENDSME